MLLCSIQPLHTDSVYWINQKTVSRHSSGNLVCKLYACIVSACSIPSVRTSTRASSCASFWTGTPSSTSPTLRTLRWSFWTCTMSWSKPRALCLAWRPSSTLSGWVSHIYVCFKILWGCFIHIQQLIFGWKEKKITINSISFSDVKNFVFC